MPRIRSVHPDICIDEGLAEISPRAERTFVRLWTHLDDEGRCLDNPKLIKAALYPLHDDMTAAEVDIDLWELIGHGMLLRYEAEGRKVLAAKPEAWHARQKPKHPSPSKLPGVPDDYTPPEPPGEPSPRPTPGRGEDRTNGASPPPAGVGNHETHELSSSTPGLPQSSPDPGNTYPGSLHGVVDGEGVGVGEGEVTRAAHAGAALAVVPGNGSSPPATGSARYPSDFEAFWTLYPRKVAKREAGNAWRKARGAASWEAITDGLRRSIAAWEAERRATDKIPHAATWLNGRRWEDDHTAPAMARPEPKGFAGIRTALENGTLT